MKKIIILILLTLNVNLIFSYQTKLIDTILFDKIDLPIKSRFMDANVDNFGNYYICALNTIDNRNKSIVLKTNDLLNWETVIDSNTTIFDENNNQIDKNTNYSFQEIHIFNSKKMFIQNIQGNYLFSPDFGKTWFSKKIDYEISIKFPKATINSDYSFNENGVGFVVLSFVQRDEINNTVKDSLFFYKTSNGGESWINIQDSTLNTTNINNRFYFEFIKVTEKGNFILQVNSYYDKNVDSIVYNPSWFISNDFGNTWTFWKDFQNVIVKQLKVKYNVFNNYDKFKFWDIKIIDENKVLIFSQMFSKSKYVPGFPDFNQEYPLLFELDLTDFSEIKLLMIDTNFYSSRIDFVENYKDKKIIFRESWLDAHLSIFEDKNNIKDWFFDDKINDFPLGFNSFFIFKNNLILTAYFYTQLYSINLDFYTSITKENTEDFETSKNSITFIFPNPSSDKISIDLGEVIGIVGVADLSIYDILGNEIITIPNYTNKTEIDISNLSIGTYTIQIQTPTGSVSQRLLVNR